MSKKPPTNDLHDRAMIFANEAVLLEKRGELNKAVELFSKAYRLEMEAALHLKNDYEMEPSRSVLFRSAAYLALKARNFREAERMAAFGLSGNPPDDVADELRDVLNQSLKQLKLVA